MRPRRMRRSHLSFAKAVVDAHPIGRMGEPDDIVWSVVSLVADEGKFATGAVTVIDGGDTERSHDAG